MRITFSEPVTPFGRGLLVIAPSGRLVSGPARVDGNTLSVPVQSAEEGGYLVEWRVVAEDTHPSRGSYTFSAGHAGPPPAAGLLPAGDVGSVAPLGLALQAIARWLHFLGFALAFGTLAFQLLVLRQDAPRLRLLVGAGIGLLVVAEPVALAGQAASFGSIDSASVADVLGSAFGRVMALRLAAPLLLWGILGALRQARGGGGWAVLALGGALAYVDGFAGHTIEGLPAAAAYLLTGIHVAAMAAWVGGLAGLLAVLPGAPVRLPLIARFGRYAAACVALLVLSGVVLALVHLKSPADLVFTAYGAVLAVKLLAVAVALALAWTGVRRLRSGRPEALALAGVVALASLLASLPPPR